VGETFLTTGESTEYGTDEIRSVQEKRQIRCALLRTACCASGRCLNHETVVVEIREAANAKMAAIYALLEQVGPPDERYSGLNPRFMVLRETGTSWRWAELQPFGSVALVRSVVVAGRSARGRAGRVIVEDWKAARAAR